MAWIDEFGQNREPTLGMMAAYVDNPLWGAMNGYMQAAYGVQPRVSFSGCSGQPGWNIKYQKAGKSLCTVYPMRGYFIMLVVIGEKERHEAELMLPSLPAYLQALYEGAGALMGARWLMIAVTDELIWDGTKRLIALRRAPGDGRRKKA